MDYESAVILNMSSDIITILQFPMNHRRNQTCLFFVEKNGLLTITQLLYYAPF